MSDEKFLYLYLINANLEKKKVGVVGHFQETVGKIRKARKNREK